jgi:hypothetical protein
LEQLHGASQPQAPDAIPAGAGVMAIERSEPDGAPRDFWLVPQIVIMLSILVGALLLLYMGFLDLAGATGMGNQQPDELEGVEVSPEEAPG